MWTKRLTALLVAFALPALLSSASAQKLFVNGGALFSDAPSESGLEGTRPAGQAGVRFEYTDLFSLQAGVSYQDLAALEGILQFHPFGRVGRTKPYAFAGFGRYVSGNDQDERSVVPLGVGVEVPLSSSIALNLEVGGRWTLATNNPPTSLDLFSGVAPTVGFSYDLGSAGTPPQPGEPAPLAEAGTQEEAGQASEAAAPPAASEGNPGRPEVAQRAPEGRVNRPGRSFGADTTGSAEGMTKLPAGTFVMGLTDEDPLSLQQSGRKRVTVIGFQMDRQEVSNADYRAYLQDLSPSRREAMRPDSMIWERVRSRSNWSSYFRGSAFDDYPVVGVNYEQAEGYCQFYGKRLPTEAEWEYAARGNLVGSIYPWPGYEPRNANGRYLANYNPDRGGYAADGYAFTAPGDAYPASVWGLYNMSGNVAEWVEDAYHSSYSDISDFNPVYEDPGEESHVVRGGSWASNAFYIGIGVRDSQPRDEASPYVGFRCVKDAGAE